MLNQLTLIRPFIFLIIFIGIGNQSHAKKRKEVIVIHEPDSSRSTKEALLILPGLGDNNKGRKSQKKFFEQTEYDLFIPDYIAQESFDSTLLKFEHFFTDQKLDEYKKLHVFSYILGSWVINSFILKNGKQNISDIVYDRSPLQERIPIVLVENIPRIANFVSGPVLKDFSSIPYPTISEKSIRIGVLIESKATSLAKHFKDEIVAKGPIKWAHPNLNQNYNDSLYTRLNHDEMYYTFEEVGNDILHFFRLGFFTKNARRNCFDWDPWLKFKKEKKA
ncbi:MAG: hypothetical protein MK066_05410 [Crocinitomicaceae bacterium]|nr:hypothetical protein [Crocinitomicaceae bacterium]